MNIIKSIVKLDHYKKFLEDAVFYYFARETFIKWFNRVPLMRYHTLKRCFEHFETHNMKTIVELGTSRSFVDGRFQGCNTNDIKYWDNNCPDKWDWSGGCFTKLISKCMNHITNINFHTVDLCPAHINRCKIMNADNNNINYHVCSSEEFLRTFNGKIDLLYMDTGDMTPVEATAQLHLREAHIIVERDIINHNGIVLIDDIRSCVPYEAGENIDMGKGYLSIPYLLNNGFELIMDEYQTILKRI
jgi:hypothetical protein